MRLRSISASLDSIGKKLAGLLDEPVLQDPPEEAPPSDPPPEESSDDESE